MSDIVTQVDRTLVERVARAIAKVGHNGRIAEPAYWENPCTGSEGYRDMARAAIDAIRALSPTTDQAHKE